MLFSASALPASTWGHQAAGIAKTTLQKLENDALGCTGIGRGRCHYSALVVFYGLSSTPFARLLSELCEAWFRMLKGGIFNSISRIDLRNAWAKAKFGIAKDTGKIHSIKGIMSNIIYNLFSLSWLPMSFDVWIDPQNCAWKLDMLDSPKGIIRQLIQCYDRQQCMAAAKHQNGRGMEEGVDWQVTLSYLQSQAFKSQEEYASKCALEAIISGSTWSNARIHAIDSEHSEFCPRCGVVDSDLHTFWLCPHNKKIEHQAVISTGKLTQIACTDSVDAPCLWLRGICPLQLTSIADEYLPSVEYHTKHIAYDESPIADAIADSGIYYGEASGGRFSSYGPLIRCGVGLVIFLGKGAFR